MPGNSIAWILKTTENSRLTRKPETSYQKTYSEEQKTTKQHKQTWLSCRMNRLVFGMSLFNVNIFDNNDKLMKCSTQNILASWQFATGCNTKR